MDTPEAGDLLFYANEGKLTDKIISWRTHSKWVHVEVYVGDGKSIGALGSGVTLHDIPPRYTLAKTSSRCDSELLPKAVTKIRAEVGDPYGWIDIANFAISLILPNGPFLTGPHFLDCSSLATLFLLWAGYNVPNDLIAEPEDVSPGRLAHAVGIEG